MSTSSPSYTLKQAVKQHSLNIRLELLQVAGNWLILKHAAVLEGHNDPPDITLVKIPVYNRPVEVAPAVVAIAIRSIVPYREHIGIIDDRVAPAVDGRNLPDNQFQLQDRSIS